MSIISSGNTISTSITITGDTTGNLVLTAQSNVVNMSTNSGAIIVPNGTTAQRPTGSNGMLRYNTTLNAFEVYANNTWALSNVTPPPVNTVAPVVSGSTTVGGNATVTTGTWNFSPTTYYYQWYANSTAISANATANVFVITSTQNGANLYCNVTAFNAAGNSSPAKSNTVGPVTSTYVMTYLAIGGGGSSGGGTAFQGGGGSGQTTSNTATVTPGTVFTATIGAGGGGSGSSTTLVGTGLSVTSIGGSPGYYNGGYGGEDFGGNSGNGYTGGAGWNWPQHPPFSGLSGGGGGAGATASGGGANNSGGGGNGGASIDYSITGSSVAYAGGGGGKGQAYPGSGGGGGAGSNGSSATANSGSGGGANGGQGGSGVVILSVPTASYSGTTTGSPTITTSGSNTIIKFTSSGTYTA